MSPWPGAEAGKDREGWRRNGRDHAAPPMTPRDRAPHDHRADEELSPHMKLAKKVKPAQTDSGEQRERAERPATKKPDSGISRPPRRFR